MTPEPTKRPVAAASIASRPGVIGGITGSVIVVTTWLAFGNEIIDFFHNLSGPKQQNVEQTTVAPRDEPKPPEKPVSNEYTISSDGPIVVGSENVTITQHGNQ